MKMEFPKDLFAELYEAFPALKDSISFFIRTNRVLSVVALVDSRIRASEAVANVAEIGFGREDDRYVQAKKQAEKFKILKDKVVAFAEA